MKTVKLISLAIVIGLASSFLLTSCENNPEEASKKDILPESFSVEIPASISKSNANGRVGGRVEGDSLKGNDIYVNLGTFIAVGKAASQIVEEFIAGIRKYHIDRVITLTYTSDDDHRTKNLIVSSAEAYEGQTWDYELSITDAESENEADGGKALQIFWNKTTPVKGIAIIKPYNCNRIKDANAKDAMFRIDYSEAGSLGYDAQMEVFISGLPLPNPLEQPYAINNLKMFVGKTGDIVDVYGNSNHPNAILFSGNAGFNWAFVASGSDPKNVAVAEVGLPPSELDSDDREVLLKEYSIKNVFTTEITSAWPGIDPEAVDAYLTNVTAPGYFSDDQGFISGGTSPGTEWDEFALRIENLSPFSPKAISELAITFK